MWTSILLGSSNGFARGDGISEFEIKIHKMGASLKIGICDKLFREHLGGDLHIYKLPVNAFYLDWNGIIYKSNSNNYTAFSDLLRCSEKIPRKGSVKVRIDTDKWKMSIYYNNKLQGKVDIDENDFYYPILESCNGLCIVEIVES